MNAPLQYSLPLKFFLHFSLPRSIFSLSNGVCIFARIYPRYIELRGHPPTFFFVIGNVRKDLRRDTLLLYQFVLYLYNSAEV